MTHVPPRRHTLMPPSIAPDAGLPAFRAHVPEAPSNALYCAPRALPLSLGRVQVTPATASSHGKTAFASRAATDIAPGIFSSSHRPTLPSTSASTTSPAPVTSPAQLRCETEEGCAILWLHLTVIVHRGAISVGGVLLKVFAAGNGSADSCFVSDVARAKMTRTGTEWVGDV